jgi:hypothetical protein
VNVYAIVTGHWRQPGRRQLLSDARRAKAEAIQHDRDDIPSVEESPLYFTAHQVMRIAAALQGGRG